MGGKSSRRSWSAEEVEKRLKKIQKEDSKDEVSEEDLADVFA